MFLRMPNADREKKVIRSIECHGYLSMTDGTHRPNAAIAGTIIGKKHSAIAARMPTPPANLIKLKKLLKAHKLGSVPEVTGARCPFSSGLA
jgi:hypothetical protein